MEKNIAIIGLLAAFIGLLPACQPSPSKQMANTPPTINTKSEKNMQPIISSTGYDITPLPPKKIAELAEKLDSEAYRITQNAATEQPFTGKLLENKQEGFYACVVCGLPLFKSSTKFNSGTGWPSFFDEFDEQHVKKIHDSTLGMQRTEIRCARCDSHLGHVFDDGPQPTGERHCVNSVSLAFISKDEVPPAESQRAPKQTTDQTQQTAVAYFAGGCFWGIEHYFAKGPGVLDAVSGYMQGKAANPSYKEVCTDTTGHAETVKVVYDPNKISYRRLLEAFFVMHDPTQLNRQGPDVGAQYRSGIWYANEQQRKEAQDYIRELQAEKKFGGRKIVTQLEAADVFYPAEEYHQDYIVKTGRACHVQNPW